MVEVKPLLVPDAFVRTYVDDREWSWIVVRRLRGARVRLDRIDRCLVELSDGAHEVAELRRLASQRLGRALPWPEFQARLEALMSSGVLVDGAIDFVVEPTPANLRYRRLDEAARARLRLLVAPGARLGCDGRGSCCRLYDRIAVLDSDVAGLLAAFPDGEWTPGGLTMESALERDRHEQFHLAARDGACMLLCEDGRCGVHARLGEARKPIGCRTYPLRDILCGDELTVSLAVECRCVIDFATTGEPLQLAAAELLTRRQATRQVEEVAPEIAATTGAMWRRERYLDWRAAAQQRLGETDDPLHWAMSEAQRLHGVADDGSVAPRLAPVAGLLGALQEHLAIEAADTARVYSPVDLQPQAFLWAASAAARLQAAAGDRLQLGAPLDGERLLVEQLLFGHGLLRGRALSTALLSLVARLALARAGRDLALPPALHPVATAEYLFRAHGVGELLDERAATLDAALTATVAA